MGYFWDYGYGGGGLYLLLIGCVLLSAYASLKVNSTFRRYANSRTRCGLTAAQVARKILNGGGLTDIRIEKVSGTLTDHYDPSAGVLRLSDSVIDSTSPAAIGVAAHEAGHALQHAEKYAPIMFRTKLVPLTNFASKTSWILILIGAVLMSIVGLGNGILMVGIVLFAVTTLFQVVTLPCEYNASNRALGILQRSGYYDREELAAAEKVLKAAALTYVAAMLTSVVQLLRLLSVFRSNRR